MRFVTLQYTQERRVVSTVETDYGKEISPYIGKCLIRCTEPFFKLRPKNKIVKAMMFLQKKRDATTGEWSRIKVGLSSLVTWRSGGMSTLISSKPTILLWANWDSSL